MESTKPKILQKFRDEIKNVPIWKWDVDARCFFLEKKWEMRVRWKFHVFLASLLFHKVFLLFRNCVWEFLVQSYQNFHTLQLYLQKKWNINYFRSKVLKKVHSSRSSRFGQCAEFCGLVNPRSDFGKLKLILWIFWNGSFSNIMNLPFRQFLKSSSMIKATIRSDKTSVKIKISKKCWVHFSFKLVKPW